MKSITKTHICVWIAATVLNAAHTISAAAQHQVPFNGMFQGDDAVNPITITTTGNGIGTHLGEFSLTQETTLTATGGTGPAHWVAANGDSIDSTFVASADFSTASLGYITVTEIHTITGGTGRFSEAQGSFTLERTHIVQPSADGTHLTFGSFHGTITSPGINHEPEKD